MPAKSSDIVYIDVQPTTETTMVASAKIHVLGLAPLKKKLGPRWDKLSDLVHKLFETAIEKVQGPSDHFMPLDELSYAVTFRDLSLTETNLACIVIAKDVCRLLFGKQIDEIAVRTIVGEIVASAFTDDCKDRALIERLIEQHGTETVVTQSVHAATRHPEVSVLSHPPRPPQLATDQIDLAHHAAANLGAGLGLFPVWELSKATSSSLILAPFTSNAGAIVSCGRRALGSADEKQILEIEIAMLNAAAAYADRVAGAGKICAIAVGVSYETLGGFHSRIRYITALQKIKTQPSTPILLKLEQIPVGTPLARVAELVAMLRAPNIRALLEFQTLMSLPSLDIKLGAIGIGGQMPAGTDHVNALLIAERVARQAANQKAFAFIDRLDTGRLVEAAISCHIRFGTGSAVSSCHFTGLEEIPEFPMTSIGE